MNEHDDLHRVLDDAVSDVHPHAGLDAIRARAADPADAAGVSGARRWLPVTVAAAAVTALVIGGVAVLAHQSRDDGGSAGPSSDSTTTTSGLDVTLPVYYVGATPHGERLYREFHRLHGVITDDASAAVTEALGTPDDPDYRSGFPAGTSAAVTASGDHAVVDLHGDFLTQDVNGASPTDGATRLQAIVYTVDAVLQRPAAVTFEIDGRPATQLLGVRLDGPVQRASQDAVVSPVLITDPAEGAHVGSDFTVTGQAATFEANVVWELKQGSTVVQHGFTTAQQCCTLSPYTFDVTGVPAGDYTLVVHDTDESGRGAVTSDSRDITVG